MSSDMSLSVQETCSPAERRTREPATIGLGPLQHALNGWKRVGTISHNCPRKSRAVSKAQRPAGAAVWGPMHGDVAAAGSGNHRVTTDQSRVRTTT
jgi:hypothetical protein